MNRTILMGRLTKDPEVTTTQSGIKKAVFTVATDGYGKDADSDFHRVTAWRTSAEFMEKYFKKGMSILVEGSNRSGSYEKDGNTVYTYEVIADRVSFTPKNDGAGASSSQSGEQSYSHQAKSMGEPVGQEKQQPTAPANTPWEMDL